MSAVAPFFRFQKVGGCVNDCLDQLKTATPSLRQKVLKQLPKETNQWIVQEKVHGANFSIYIRRNPEFKAGSPKSGEFQIRFAKRNGFLDFEQDCFYNFQSIAAQLRQSSVQVFEAIESLSWVGQSSRDNLLVVIYGELFGGWYPSGAETWAAEVASRIEAGKVKIPFARRAVQEGIYYSDGLEFMVFDVGTYSAGGPSELRFLDFPELQRVVAQRSSFLFAAPLAVFDTYEKAAFDFSLDFDSTIPGLVNERRRRDDVGYGAKEFLPTAPPGQNTAEGLIIRPARNVSFQQLAGNLGAKAGGGAPSSAEGDPQSAVRPLVKRKHAKFAEVVDNLDAEGGGGAESKSYAFVFAARLINNNRLSAVLSKTGGAPLVVVDGGREGNGVPTDEAATEIAELLAADSWEDWYLNFNYQIEDYDEAQDYVLDLCRKLVRAERW